MTESKKLSPPFTKTLLWRIALVFLGIFLLVGIIYTVITAYTARLYYQETTQKLNAGIAKQIEKDVEPFTNGKPNKEALKELFHYTMVINPAIEVYLLDKQGNILTFFAPDRKVKLDRVSLKPIQNFIASKGKKFIRGVDPKNPEKKEVFSAAEVKNDEQTQGYIYVILASKNYESVTETLLGSYILKGGTMAFVITLIIATGIGLALIWVVTKYMRKVLSTVNSFKEGHLSDRVPIKSDDELGQLGRAFNDMADTIESNMKQIQQMEQARKELVANVSHDLRTPLTTLQGYAETLAIKKDQLSEAQQSQYLNSVLQNAERLKKLVEELFELSRLETRQIQPHKEPFFINELLYDIVSKYRLKAAEKAVEIKPVLPNDLPPVYADVSMIDRVIQNLVDNALKFTSEEGTVALELRKISGHVEVRISDTGPGITQDNQEFVFKRYRKAKDSREQINEGAGLGLAIVKNMLEIQGFQIQMNSTPGQGTTFYFRVPVYNQSAG